MAEQADAADLKSAGARPRVGSNPIPGTILFQGDVSMDSPISLRKAEPKDESDFAELFLISAPFFAELFKENARKVLRRLFSSPRNLFSFEHVCFAEVSGEIAGLLLSYDARTHRREYLRTGGLLFESLRFKMIRIFHVLLRLNSNLGRLGKGDYYISNLAVYPRFRGIGIGKVLMRKAEENARNIGSKRLVLETEENNIVAVGLYKKLGFEITEKFQLKLSKDLVLNFCRMVKPLG